MIVKKIIQNTILIIALCVASFGQTGVPYAFLTSPRLQFLDANGSPLAGGFLYSFAAGTNTPLATEHLDTLGHITPNQNPIQLDSAGTAEVRLLPQAYKFVLQDVNHSQVWQVDQVEDVGQILYSQAVLLNPVGAALQTIVGPLAASWFVGTTAHTTSPGVRVSLLDPTTILDTTPNPPTMFSVAPALSGQVDAIPDSGSFNSTFVLSPGPADWQASTTYVLGTVILPRTNNPCHNTYIVAAPGTTGTTNPTFSTTGCGLVPSFFDGTVEWTSQGVYSNANVLDCTQAGLTCKRTAYFYLEGGGCNNTTAGLGWDTFGTNSPTPLCITGTNVQKGVMALPSAATYIQENTGTGAAATTCTTTYPATTTAGHLLEVEIAVDTSRTISGVTDGTNAYTRAIAIANGTTNLEIWYFNGNSASKAAGTTLTATLSAAGNCALDWKEYDGILTASALDVTASGTGSSTAVSTGTTAGTFQNTELVLAAVASPSNPSVTATSGFTGHQTVAQSTNVTIFSEGKIQQASGTQTAAITLSTSQAYAAAIVTFKANVASTTSAQRQIALPAYFLNTAPVNSAIKWQTYTAPTGVVNTVLGAAIVCTADGSTDDPPFNAPVFSTVPVSQTGPVIITTPLVNLPSTGCSPSNLLHYQIQRARYNASDSYEGFVLVDGASLQLGVSQ